MRPAPLAPLAAAAVPAAGRELVAAAARGATPPLAATAALVDGYAAPTWAAAVASSVIASAASFWAELHQLLAVEETDDHREEAPVETFVISSGSVTVAETVAETVATLAATRSLMPLSATFLPKSLDFSATTAAEVRATSDSLLTAEEANADRAAVLQAGRQRQAAPGERVVRREWCGS